MKYINILTSIILLGLSVSAFAQDEKTVQKLSVFEQATEEQNRTTHFAKGVAERSLTSQLSIGGVEFSDPEFNFFPSSQLQAAGDINGDGYDDFFYTVFAADETTEDLSDQVTKLVVYYGSENGLEAGNTEFIRDGFTFIADVTGDGTSEALRFEDGVLYLVVDESGGELEAIVDVEVLQLQYNSVDYRSYGDFDGDGFNDILVYNTGTTIANATNEFYLVYGADSYEDISIDTLSYTNGVNWRRDNMIYSDVDNDGTSEVIMVSSGDSDTGAGVGVISIFQKNESDEFERVREDTLEEGFFNSYTSMNSGQIGVADLNGDDNEELIIYADLQLRIFTVSEEEGEFYTSETMLEDTFDANGFSIINDFDDDGAKELLITHPESVLLVTSDAELEFTGTDLAMDDGDVIGLLANRTKNHNSGGDVNGDGIADIVVEFSNDNNREYGYRAYHGNSAGNFDTTSEIRFSFTAPNETGSIYHSTNAGDLNGDGVEDLALTYHNVIEIYFGGGTFEEPDFTIERMDENFWMVFAPASGDFNGDGYEDLVVNFSGDSLTAGLYYFFGGPDFNAESDHTILLSDIDVEEFQENAASSGFPAVANIGDINGDGVHDLIASNSFYSSNTFIYLGGESFSIEPDHIIPVGASVFANLGDFRENGYPHYAVSGGAGNVWVFEGYDSSEGGEFSPEPVLTIPPPYETGISVWADVMTAGDFNGNGRKELAVSPLFHQKNSGVGYEAIYFYEGGAEADSIYDHAIALRGEDLNFEAGFFGGPNLDSLNISAIGLQSVKDLNEDGRDELLISTWNQRFSAFIQSNAVLYYGNEELSEMDGEYDVVFEGPNPIIGLGVYLNSSASSTSKSAVGDFNNNGLTNFVFTQQADFNFQRNFAYMYEDPLSVGTEDEVVEAIKGFKLNQNYPNPFNPTTKISYSLPATGDVKLQVFDITGRLVSTVVNQRQVAGSYVQNFNASAFASGVYIYRLQAAGFTQTRKMLLIK